MNPSNERASLITLPAAQYMKITTLLAMTTLALVAAVPVSAQEFSRTPLPNNHPLVGTWRIELPGGKCFEEYDVRSDGTKLSMSGEERNESEFMISLVPKRERVLQVDGQNLEEQWQA